MNRPRLLDLFCGAGGAAKGYDRAGFEVVGVDIAPQPHYPFEFHQGDAMTWPLDGFDAIHASPHVDVPWVVENVVGASMGHFVVLCGSSGRLSKALRAERPWTQNTTAEQARAAMGIDWMTRDELAQAIPPAYTEHIGQQLMAYVQERVA